MLLKQRDDLQSSLALKNQAKTEILGGVAAPVRSGASVISKAII